MIGTQIEAPTYRRTMLEGSSTIMSVIHCQTERAEVSELTEDVEQREADVVLIARKADSSLIVNQSKARHV